jgi:hypothetical protein
MGRWNQCRPSSTIPRHVIEEVGVNQLGSPSAHSGESIADVGGLDQHRFVPYEGGKLLTDCVTTQVSSKLVWSNATEEHRKGTDAGSGK